MDKNYLLKQKGDLGIGAFKRGWHIDNAWDTQRIEAIEDIAGANMNRKITSYPTPLARMHLFHDAFAFVTGQEPQNPPTIYEKAVSDCLDVWEILFYMETYKTQKVDFVEWIIADEIDKLKNSPLDGFKLLGETFELFFAGANNAHMNSISKIYILTHDGVAFAGSSPYTGFFTSSEDITFKLKIQNSNACFFEKVRAFHSRSAEFKQYMLAFAASQGIDTLFKHLYKYLFAAANSYLPNRDIYTYNNEVRNSTGSTLHLLDRANNITMMAYRQEFLPACGFYIKSDKVNEKLQGDQYYKCPLVVKTNPGGTEKLYIGNNFWNNDIIVPHYVREAIEQRNAPSTGVQHPWLCTSDFLEELLIELPYDIDDNKFHTFTKGTASRYLIPIKPAYFEYFTFEDLYKDGTFTITITPGGTVEVELKIPIGAMQTTPYREIVEKEKLIFKRVYQKIDNALVALSEVRKDKDGRGFILDYPFGLFMFPFFKVGNAQFDDFYRIGCIDNEQKGANTTVDLDFFAYNHPQPIQNMTPEGVGKRKYSRLLKKGGVNAGSDYYAIQGTTFDYIQAITKPRGSEDTAKGLLIPKWEKKTLGNTSFKFAVDFGTSTTHIAYMQGGNNPTAFDIKENEMQVVRLDKIGQTKQGATITAKYDERQIREDGLTLDNTIDRQRFEFFPSIIGYHYVFPLQTALKHIQDVRLPADTDIVTLGTANIPFFLNKRNDAVAQDVIATNLKWRVATTRDIRRTEVFIEELLYLIRHKTLMNGGDPSALTVYWFTPLSMPLHIQNSLATIWTNKYRDIFHANNQPIKLTESEAPYFVQQNVHGGFNGGQVLSIDIGGGTTDILLFKGNNVSLANSCTFAGNAVFGNWNIFANNLNNGLVTAFKGDMRQILLQLVESATASGDSNTQIKMKDYLKLHDDYLNPANNFNSPDVISFWLSVKELDFAGKFNLHKDFKLPFLLYFGALFYHCAQILDDQKCFQDISDICFSGNGSKMLDIISPDRNTIEDFANHIFQAYKKGLTKHVKIHAIANPKEATCNGALFSNLDNSMVLGRPEGLYFHLGEDLPFADDRKATVAQNAGSLTYAELKTAIGNKSESTWSTNSEYAKFIRIFFEVYDKMNLPNAMGIAIPEQKLKYLLLDNVKGEMTRGIDFQILRGGANLTPTSRIMETIFFYPVMSGIYRLLEELSNKKNGIPSRL